MGMVQGWNMRGASAGSAGGFYFYGEGALQSSDFTYKVNEDSIRQWKNSFDIYDALSIGTQDFFSDWLRPTDSERILFEIEFGISYVDQSLLDKYSSSA